MEVNRILKSKETSKSQWKATSQRTRNSSTKINSIIDRTGNATLEIVLKEQRPDSKTKVSKCVVLNSELHHILYSTSCFLTEYLYSCCFLSQSCSQCVCWLSLPTFLMTDEIVSLPYRFLVFLKATGG